MLRNVLILLSGPFLCLACHDGAIEPSQSLVGAKRLPSGKALSGETFYITLGGSEFGDKLTYEWRPDDRLTVTHTFRDGQAPAEILKGKGTLRISPEVAPEVRQLLWRVRPATLEGVEQDARPVGCERTGPHDWGEASVGFIKEGSEIGIDDDQIGVFTLPSAASCNTPAAVDARKVVRRALQMLPGSTLAAKLML